MKKLLIMIFSLPLAIESMEQAERNAAPVAAQNLETILWIVNATPKDYLLYDRSHNKVADIPKSRETKINLSSKWVKKDPAAKPSIYLSIMKDNLKKLRFVLNIWSGRPDTHALGLTLLGDAEPLGNELLPYDPLKGAPGFQIRLVLKGENLEKSYFDLSGSQR